jgi:hypothetical protein
MVDGSASETGTTQDGPEVLSDDINTGLETPVEF